MQLFKIFSVLWNGPKEREKKRKVGITNSVVCPKVKYQKFIYKGKNCYKIAWLMSTDIRTATSKLHLKAFQCLFRPMKSLDNFVRT